MQEVVKFLQENPVQFLATTGLDGKPKNRPFQFMLEKGGKLYYCTSSQKDVYQELMKDPYVEISASLPEFAWIRLSGKVEFADDMEVKAAIIEHSPLVKSIYQTPDNPVFVIFYLADAQATITDFSGQPPRKYSL